MRIVQEKERRILQHETYRRQQKITHKKVEARVFGKSVLSGIRGETLTHLENRGFLFEDRTTNIQINFMPWLYN